MNTRPDEIPGPSSATRTTINVLLMVHFVFIAVAVTVNFQPVSSFRLRLQNIPFAPLYAKLLSQDILYNGPLANFAITDGQFDRDYRCRVLLDWRDGMENDPAAVAQLEQIDLLPEGVWPNVRRQRYLQLAKYTGLSEGDSIESLLPQAISDYLLMEVHNIPPTMGERHRFQCNERLLQDLPNLRSIDPQERDPMADRWLSTRYEADLVGTGQQWAPNKVAGREEVTQVQPIGGTGGGESSPRAPQGDR